MSHFLSPERWLRSVVLACSTAYMLAGPGPAHADVTACRISGQVVDASGSPLGGVLIVAAGPSVRHAEATSNDAGKFCFAEIQPGDVTLTLKLPGFITVELSGLGVTSNDRLELRPVMDRPVYVAEVNEKKGEAVPGSEATRAGSNCEVRDPWPIAAAIGCLRGEALGGSKGVPSAPLNRGIGLLKAGDLEGALAAFSEIIGSATHGLPDAYFFRAITNCRLRRTEMAKRDLEKFLAIDPKNSHSAAAHTLLNEVSNGMNNHCH